MCTCLDDTRDENQEFPIGTGIYAFKKIVSKYLILIILYFFINYKVITKITKSKEILWKR